MSNLNTTYDQFLRYHQNEMTSEELAVFREKLNADSKFKQEYQDFSMSQHIMLDARLASTKLKLNDIMSNTPLKKKSNSVVKLGIFGGAIVLFLLTYVMYPTAKLEKKSASDKVNIEESVNNPETETTVIEPKETSNEKEEQNNEPVQVEIETTQSNESIKQKSEIITTPESLEDTNTIVTQQGIELSDNNEAVELVEVTQTKASPEIEVTEHTKPIDLCAGKSITLVSGSKASCDNEDNGVISITEITGGKAPYSIAINLEGQDVDKYNPVAGNAYAKKALASGKYIVQIKDSEGCPNGSEEVVVESKECKDYSGKIIRTAGQFWTVPQGYDGSLKIINLATGSVVYQLQVDKGINYEWQGTETSGSALPNGEYFFVFTTSEQEIIDGYISIIN